MNLPPDAPKIIEYRCNICGRKNQLESYKFHRELAACRICGASARLRGIIYVLANLLGEDETMPLRDWSMHKEIIGMGMSDWPGYANFLRRKFSYENTFYDRKPQLDILDVTEKYLGKYDFVISSDVLEHILPPIQQGFDNLGRLLKPGGKLVFSVPYTRSEQTLEHFPGLFDYEILYFRGQRILVNRDVAGCLQVYDHLIFHGGHGRPLEMRMLCESDVLRRLAQAGFENIKIYDQPKLSIGYYWPELQSADPNAPPVYAYIISALRAA